MAAIQPRDGQHDFDFLFGAWRVHNRRLRNPLAGSGDWYEFDATSVAKPVWNGMANVDEFEGMGPDGPILGMTVRLYDRASGQWRLNWANARTGAFGVPTIGSFDANGLGEFFDQEDFQGRAIFVRYTWSGITASSCRWEQAFSDDGGATWETNWVMEFTREM